MQALKSFFSKTGSGSGSGAKTADEYSEKTKYSSLFFDRLERNAIQPFVGLAAKSAPASNTFELTDFNIDTTVSDAAVVSVWTQRYKNGNTSPVEAKYQMPLAPQAAVSSFVVTYDDKVLIAKIKEKEAAQNKYSDAIASGHQAFMVEKNDNGSFTTMIGNLPPTKEVTVTLTIVSEIGTYLDEYYYGLHRYMFPTKGFNLTLNMDVQLSSAIQSVKVLNYNHADTKVDGNKAKLTLRHEGKIDKNIIVVINQKDNTQRPTYFLEKSVSDSTYALGINYYPHMSVAPEDVDQKSEFIFLLDCSGSMSGGAIAKAKRALEILMRSLTEKSKFNIWLFGSSYNSLFPESRLYDDSSLERASEFITHIDANLGGTELLPPIQAILRNPNDSQYPRQVFILTDGEVSQRDELVDYVAKEANTTRIFTLGIGGGVDRQLVTGLSMACKGYFEFINDNAQMETQVMKLMSIAMEPTISNIQVDWDGLEVVQAPANIRPLFNNERMMIYALVKSEPTTLNKSIKITADGPTGQTLSYEVAVDFAQAQRSSDSLHTLSAALAIRDLEEKERKQPKTKQECKDQIVALGKKYHLISKHTSFVVVSESSTPTEDTMVVVDVKPTSTANNSMYRGAPGGGGGGGRGGSRLGNAMAMTKSSSVRSSSISRSLAQPMSQGDFDDDLNDGNSSGSDDDDDDECEEEEMDEVNEQMDFLESGVQQVQSADDCMAPAPKMRSIKLMKEKQAPRKKSFDASGQKDKKMRCESPSKPTSSIRPSGAPTPKPTTGDPLMDVIRTQKANGSWSALPHSLTVSGSIIDDLKSFPDVWTTLLVICKLEKSFADKKAQWDKLVIKAQRWVKSQLTGASMGDKYDIFLAKAKAAL
ncbi:hypothetical protein SAMD00019534_073030 [Acytostelium subglobosum LB1]|uniref:hypothetical protein n=1 Tax=Acytostelium subglobosum LB1 TaxID=1410327 RepID=UPI000644878D|nr:hypothetical protein SAMD00019534_073030 [Acytostelium subglobosum LB1]GAM24128.1 hypothetical protein SAMD00019534_073030 [Acytostelium subglobosum LB1]|eukprot:XP_012753164.1 hypothetical protein SAMD00019534_073030 [Acytostelium subglobosum LB1]